MITAPEPILSTIVEHIELIDHPLEQIMIEIMVVEINKTAAREVGIEWRWDSFGFNVGDQPAAGPMGGRSRLSWTEATLADMINLRALIQDELATVRANPRLSTLSAHKAELFVGREQYFALLRGTQF